jgi:NAD(P)-dependent dehydrogenase (short-subunit alcohol dehydrogenase family)
MSNPVVIVTGASRGLGAATAHMAASFGARLVLSGRSSADLDAQVTKIGELGGKAVAVVADLAKEEGCEHLVESALSSFGQVDALVNNAGIVEPIGPIAKTIMSGWEKNIRINLLAPIMLTHFALPFLREVNGRVINISSGAAVKVVRGWGAYCVAKAGLNHFTRVLAEEEPSITTIAVRPGVVDTQMQQMVRIMGKAGMPESTHRDFVNLHKDGKLLQPEVPAEAIAVLALRVPHEWSGEFIAWNDERVQGVVKAMRPQ